MNSTLKRNFLLLVSLTIASISFAQSGESKRGATPNAIPPPAAEFQSLTKAFAGRWATTYDFVPGVMSAAGGSGTGEEIWRPGPGGYVLLEEEHALTPDGELFLMALHWWDKNTNSLRGMLCNNSGPEPCNVNTYFNSTLKWDGKQLIIEMRFSQGEKKMLWHEEWSDITTTTFTQTGEMGEVGGPLKKAVTIHAVKIPAEEVGAKAEAR